jgi:hypothetical protein
MRPGQQPGVGDIIIAIRLASRRHRPSAVMAVGMVHKWKSSSQRLAREIKAARLMSGLISPSQKPPDWSDKRIRQIVAELSLTLSGSPGEAPLREAFEKFGFDPQDPLNWRRLLNRLVALHFGLRKRLPRGAPVAWNAERRRLFETHIAMVKRSYNDWSKKHGGWGAQTGEDIALYLRSKWPEHYGNIETEIVRRYIASGPPGTKKSG